MEVVLQETQVLQVELVYELEMLQETLVQLVLQVELETLVYELE